MSFADKVVLVTGASRGIGKVIAQQFAERDARVAVHFNQNLEAAERTLASLPGGPHSLVKADIQRADAVEDLVDVAIRKMGKIDVLVNNAGVFIEHRLVDISYEQWQEQWLQTVQTNLLGPANLTFCVARHMIQNEGGRIVNVSSRGAFRGEPDAPAYGASKAGLNAMGQSLAKALAPHNIFVYTVAPGFVQTDMVRPILAGEEGEAIRQQSPLGRVAYPEEIARTVVFLASEGTDFLTGCIVDVNGASYLRT